MWIVAFFMHLAPPPFFKSTSQTHQIKKILFKGIYLQIKIPFWVMKIDFSLFRVCWVFVFFLNHGSVHNFLRTYSWQRWNERLESYVPSIVGKALGVPFQRQRAELPCFYSSAAHCSVLTYFWGFNFLFLMVVWHDVILTGNKKKCRYY